MDQGTEALRVIIVSARFPWPPYTGDRLRVIRWLEALRETGSVTLVAPGGEIPPEFSHVDHVRVRRSPLSLLFSAVQAVLRRLPLHSLITSGFNWKTALRKARHRGEFDVAVVMLSRLDPWVRDHVRARRRILDAVDSLARSVGERADAAAGLARLFWRSEADKMKALEKEVVRHYQQVVVVSADEQSFFGGQAVVIPIGIDSRFSDNAVETEKQYDFGFWGRLGFFANHDGADILLAEVWPRIRARLPKATLLIAGADAPPSLRRHHGKNGVSVISPVADLRSLIRKVRIAIFPIRFGNGQSIKALEAAAAGCAILGTPRALRGVGSLAAGTIIEPAPAQLADHAISLLERPEQIRDMGRRSKEAVEKHFSARAMEERMRALAIGSPERTA